MVSSPYTWNRITLRNCFVVCLGKKKIIITKNKVFPKDNMEIEKDLNNNNNNNNKKQDKNNKSSNYRLGDLIRKSNCMFI